MKASVICLLILVLTVVQAVSLSKSWKAARTLTEVKASCGECGTQVMKGNKKGSNYLPKPCCCGTPTTCETSVAACGGAKTDIKGDGVDGYLPKTRETCLATWRPPAALATTTAAANGANVNPTTTCHLNVPDLDGIAMQVTGTTNFFWLGYQLLGTAVRAAPEAEMVTALDIDGATLASTYFTSWLDAAHTNEAANGKKVRDALLSTGTKKFNTHIGMAVTAVMLNGGCLVNFICLADNSAGHTEQRCGTWLKEALDVLVDQGPGVDSVHEHFVQLLPMCTESCEQFYFKPVTGWQPTVVAKLGVADHEVVVTNLGLRAALCNDKEIVYSAKQGKGAIGACMED